MLNVCGNDWRWAKYSSVECKINGMCIEPVFDETKKTISKSSSTSGLKPITHQHVWVSKIQTCLSLDAVCCLDLGNDRIGSQRTSAVETFGAHEFFLVGQTWNRLKELAARRTKVNDLRMRFTIFKCKQVYVHPRKEKENCCKKKNLEPVN